MTPEQQSALEGVAGRALTPEEASQIDALLPHRDDVAIAALLSVGRRRLQHKPIGYGTILEILGAQGGAFIDTLVSLGTEDRNVHWGMEPLSRGEFDIGLAPAQYQLGILAGSLPQFADGIASLQALGYVPDPLNFNAVSDALNVAEGRATL